MKHASAQAELVRWKYDNFLHLTSTPPQETTQELRGKSYGAVRFSTRTNPILSMWAGKFYHEGRKRVPSNVKDFLSPLALATLVMDDGNADFAGVAINTQSFTADDVAHLQKALQDRYSIGSRQRAERGKYTILYVPSAMTGRLREVTEKHVLESLRYKLYPRRERTP